MEALEVESDFKRIKKKIKYPLKTFAIKGFLDVYRIHASSLMHRLGKAIKSKFRDKLKVY